MKVTERCARCLYDHQRRRVSDEDYLAEVQALIDARGEDDCAPVLVYRFSQAYARRFGAPDSYADVKRSYNDLVLNLEKALQARIEAAGDPVAAALGFARAGNYIDFGAMDDVEEATFLRLFDSAALRPEEDGVYRRFLEACAAGSRLMLIADNCGEIVLDRLLLEQLKRRFPQLKMQVLVRGGEVLNDATLQDAVYAGVDRVAEILTNGTSVAGTVPDMLPAAVLRELDAADVILAKGQGNYESLSGHGRRAFYAFLCKCGLFTSRFQVPPLTGMLLEETGTASG